MCYSYLQLQTHSYSYLVATMQEMNRHYMNDATSHIIRVPLYHSIELPHLLYQNQLDPRLPSLQLRSITKSLPTNKKKTRRLKEVEPPSLLPPPLPSPHPNDGLGCVGDL